MSIHQLRLKLLSADFFNNFDTSLLFLLSLDRIDFFIILFNLFLILILLNLLQSSTIILCLFQFQLLQ